ncbi:MAG: dTDP-Rha--alpha-D-GlcNAc-pyrophosphate polyprenol alpha-3-L-rhamnosyltransferase [Nitrosomonadaceae bacterium]|nr:dTDP-Rha--alpha-D-GlcNAc-pyrophosphate polyprenol alpha-3-L-rhamnosyltransferase [Nitrosomonadaceae bacterium]|tara:strand:+ start:1664 stop:2578 length:915 start_codon:yes stop_codon:yes gene_type:complete
MILSSSSQDLLRENDVSIVVVNYNAGDFLLPCIELCLQQVGQVVLVDNASVDLSIDEVLSRFGVDSNLQIIRNEENLGFSAACNIGAKEATGEFILFLNPDCIMEEGAVKQLKLALESNPSAGMAGALLLDEDGKEQAGARRVVPTPWWLLVRSFHFPLFMERWHRLFTDFNLHKQKLPSSPIEVEAISGACTMVSQRAMHDVGLWDESYFLHCEDLDLCMRYRQKKWSILFVPSSRIIHHCGVCSKSRPVFVEWHKHRGMLRFYNKFFKHQYPSVLLWFVTIGVWLRFCVVIASLKFQRVIGR